VQPLEPQRLRVRNDRMKMSAAILLLSVPLPAHAHAQVIEVGEGATRTFAGPTRFTDGAPEPILPARAPAVARTNPLAASIAASAAAHGLDPRLVEAVAWRESRFRVAALSSRGALGPMQLMPATARALGVDPRDPEANIAGGAHYLRQMADRFGDWRLALAAYNAGPGAVARWGGVPPFAETRAYVTDVLARWVGPRLALTLPVPAPPANPLLIEVPPL